MLMRRCIPLPTPPLMRIDTPAKSSPWRSTLYQRYKRSQICGATRNLRTDHNHKTGQIRGTLCNGCNTALGHFGDDLAGVQRTVAYLQRGDTEHSYQQFAERRALPPPLSLASPSMLRTSAHLREQQVRMLATGAAKSMRTNFVKPRIEYLHTV